MGDNKGAVNMSTIPHISDLLGTEKGRKHCYVRSFVRSFIQDDTFSRAVLQNGPVG